MFPSEAIAQYRLGETISEIALTYGVPERAVRAALAGSAGSSPSAAARVRKRTRNELCYRAVAKRLRPT
jgi:uncharacterized membrane protein